MRRWLALICSLTVILATACSTEPTVDTPPLPTATTAAPDPRVTKDVLYGKGATQNGAKELLADLYRPEGTPPATGWPGVVYVHGGGFVRGSKNDRSITRLAKALSDQGFVVASIDYRLEYDSPTPEATQLVEHFKNSPGYASEKMGPALQPSISAAVEDTIAALTWFGGQSEAPVDPQRVAVAGDSAGAITAMHTAYLANNVQLERPPVAAVVDLWGGFIATPQDASAIEAGEPPLFMVHGTADALVPYQLAQVAAAQANTVQVPHTLHSVDGANHGFSAVDLFKGTTKEGPTYFDAMVAFLKQHTTSA